MHEKHEKTNAMRQLDRKKAALRRSSSAATGIIKT